MLRPYNLTHAEELILENYLRIYNHNTKDPYSFIDSWSNLGVKFLKESIKKINNESEDNCRWSAERDYLRAMKIVYPKALLVAIDNERPTILKYIETEINGWTNNVLEGLYDTV